MSVDFKEWGRMPPDSPHPHKDNPDVPYSTRWVRFDKGHYVTRPYFKYSTSKWDASIIDVYEVLFDPFKHEPIKVLELGVYYGASMEYFQDFFTHSDTKIIGVDHNRYEGQSDFDPAALSKVIYEIADQRDRPAMKAIAKKHGPFDIVIDDGNHDADACQFSFEDFWPFVKDGGFYIIEDTAPAAIGADLLNEIVSTRQGKGFTTHHGTRGFGPEASVHGLTVLKKTQNLITGLDEDLLV